MNKIQAGKERTKVERIKIGKHDISVFWSTLEYDVKDSTACLIQHSQGGVHMQQIEYVGSFVKNQLNKLKHSFDVPYT